MAMAMAMAAYARPLRPVLRCRAPPIGPLASLIARNAMRGAMGRTTAACALCGRAYEPYRRPGSNAYCKRCIAKADREIAKTLSVDCKECGRAFSTRTRTVRYCSDQCRSAGARRGRVESHRRYVADPEKRALQLARVRRLVAAGRSRKRGNKQPPPRAGRGAARPRRSAKSAEPYPCALCGRDFAPYGGGAHPVHCKRCAAKADKEIDRKRTLDCKECGARFSTPNRAVRYCSKACSAAGQRRSTRERGRRRMADPEKRAVDLARRRAWAAANSAKEGGRGRRPNA